MGKLTKRQRDILCQLRETVADYQCYVPYTRDKELMDIFGYISQVLFAVLTDDPENEFLEEDWETADNAIEEFKKLLERGKKIQ